MRRRASRWLVRGITTWLVLLAALPAVHAGSTLWQDEASRSRVFNALVDVFRDHYWQADFVDWDAWADRYRVRVVSAASRQAFDGAFRGMVNALGDGHSSWLGLASYDGEGGTDPDEPQPSLGVVTRYLGGSGMVVERVLPRSPAERAGLLRGDVLIRVGEVALADAGSRGASVALGGAVAAGRVDVAVRRARRTFELSITPVLLSRELLAAEPSGRLLADETAYLYIPSFTRHDTGARVHGLVRQFKAEGARRMIVDLRGNIGGNLNQLGLTLGVFLDEGTWAVATSRGAVAWRASYAVEAGTGVSRLRTTDGRIVDEAWIQEPVRFTGPLVVLVDEQNSSAGEVAALVLQASQRALVVGRRTAGNVEAVQGFPLPDGSVVMVAVANLQGVDGRSFDGGVVPDMVAQSNISELARGFDAPEAVARSLLAPLPFVPGKLF